MWLAFRLRSKCKLFCLGIIIFFMSESYIRTAGSPAVFCRQNKVGMQAFHNRCNMRSGHLERQKDLLTLEAGLAATKF